MSYRKARKYRHIVDNHLKDKGKSIYGMTDDRTKTVKVNKKLSKTHPLKKRPVKKGASKYPEVKDTLYHELWHEKHPKATEKETYKKTHQAMKTISKKASQKLYNKFK